MGEPTAELTKLAHQLGVAPDRLACVASLSAEDLRSLRRRIGDYLFEADKHHFSRMATLAKAVPVPIAAKVSEAVLPPLLAARTAELFDPHRAAEMVQRMSSRYLADASMAMDPARSPQVIAAIPPDRVAEVGRELARRREWVVMGAFVSFVSPAALRASVAVLTGEHLLRISFVLEDNARLAEISELLTPRQLDDLLASAARHSLWAELGALCAELDETQTQRLTERLAAAPPEVVTAIHKAGVL